ncbi:hypothetical protein M8J75_016190 [Diaphorina citri]|nr:hypothetical protein M8J75_016190 [Diaphorina citri]
MFMSHVNEIVRLRCGRRRPRKQQPSSRTKLLQGTKPCSPRDPRSILPPHRLQGAQGSRPGVHQGEGLRPPS